MLNLLQRRLANQFLAGGAPRTPTGVVREFGAIQAQDLPGAAWAVGRRSGATGRDVTAALAAGDVLRTHLLRPTWHLVAREDLRELVALTGANVDRAARTVYRGLGLDERVLRRGEEVLEAALAAGPATRDEAAEALTAAGIDAGGGRLGNLLLHAEAVGLICSGPPREGTQTVALVRDRTPGTAPRPRELVLAALARRYFRTRGPASARDFAWWSGLPAADARAAVAAVRDELVGERHQGRELLSAPSGSDGTAEGVLLLPNYDEYAIAYADRSDLFDERHRVLLDRRRNPVFNHVVVVDGVIAGTWRAAANRAGVRVSARLFEEPTARIGDGVAAAADGYARYREQQLADLEVT